MKSYFIRCFLPYSFTPTLFIIILSSKKKLINFFFFILNWTPSMLIINNLADYLRPFFETCWTNGKWSFSTFLVSWQELSPFWSQCQPATPFCNTHPWTPSGIATTCFPTWLQSSCSIVKKLIVFSTWRQPFKVK